MQNPNVQPAQGGSGADHATDRSAVPGGRAEALRRVHVFADLPGEQLEWFAGHTQERTLEAGQVLFRKGDAPEYMIVYLEGEMHARREESFAEGTVYIARAGDPATEVSGMLPFSRMRQFSATSYAVTPTRLLLFPARLFPEMMQRMPVLVERLVGIMSDRVRMVTQEDQQRDKLMALGKLSAGLAHELNNPAAAAHRGADELLDMLEQLRQADLRLCGHHLTAGQLNFLVEFERNLIRDSATAPPLGALEQSDREEELIGWLEEHGMEDGWQLAAVFAGAGIDNEQLEQVCQQVGEVALADALTRIGVQLSINRLVTDIRTSAGRISELVGAIKEYTYMDQALVQEVDLHKGLENTLIILRHKLREKNITVTREFADNLPPLKVYGSALNQVWTNLIDNAVDAMTEGGQLRVHTRREPTHILIEIRDNGTGIAPEAQGHIFEPFYTTKAVGEGTGLGLDTVARIVRKHHGEIRLESRPGDTCFQVRLPFHQV